MHAFLLIRWSTAAVEQWHHHKVKAARSISTFWTSAVTVTEILNAGKFSPHHLKVYFHLFRGPPYYCTIAALRFEISFLYSLQEGYKAPAESCIARHANPISHSSVSLLTLSYAVYQICTVGWLKAHTKSEVQFFRTSQLSFRGGCKNCKCMKKHSINQKYENWKR